MTTLSGIRTLVLGVAAGVLFATSAHALSLDLDDCDSFGCQGASIGLDVGDNGDGTFTALLSIDTTGFTGDRTALTSASFKAVQGFTAIDLVSPPGGSWGAATENNINNGDCSGSGNDFVCTEGAVTIGAATEPGTWQFLVTGGSLRPLEDWHIGFKYGPGNGQIISASAPPIPEPAAVAVFGLGALLVAGAARRARRR